MNQMSHQESETANLQKLTSNKGPLLTKPVLWFHLSWGDLIILPIVMVMLRFTLNILQLSLTMNMFHIQTPLQKNQLMVIKWNLSYNYSTHNIMMIFWAFAFRCSRLDQWSPLLQNFIQSLLCCSINMQELMLQSQIECHTFICLSQPRPL